MKNRLRIFCLFQGVLVLLLSFSSCKRLGLTLDAYVFKEIGECEALETSDRKDAKFEKYETPSEDKKLKKLEYETFFGGKYSCDEFSFEIFAYEFKDSDTAKKYYENVTGGISGFDANFSKIARMSSFIMVVLNNEFSYTIYTSPHNAGAVQDFISEIFSLEIYFDAENNTRTVREKLSSEVQSGVGGDSMYGGETLTHWYFYTSEGQLRRFDNLTSGKSSVYKYDADGRMTAAVESDTEKMINHSMGGLL